MCQWVKCHKELPPDGWTGRIAYRYCDSQNSDMMQIEAEYRIDDKYPLGMFEIFGQDTRPINEVFCWLKLPDLPPLFEPEQPQAKPEPQPGIERHLWHEEQLNKAMMRERDYLKLDIAVLQQKAREAQLKMDDVKQPPEEPEPPPGLEHQLWHQKQLNQSLIRERDYLKLDVAFLKKKVHEDQSKVDAADDLLFKIQTLEQRIQEAESKAYYLGRRNAKLRRRYERLKQWFDENET